MKFKSLICLATVAVTSSVSAQETESNKNINIIGGLGATFLNDMDPQLGSDNKMKGAELNFSGLYSFPKFGMVSPVAGLGLHSAYTTRKEGSARIDAYWTSLEANAGVKIDIVPQFSLFTLANVGYAIGTRTEVKAGDVTIGTDAKNHYYFGATAMGIVPVTSTVGVGAMFSYNRHSLETKDSSVKLTFDQYTTGVVVSYSL
ncbi:hypothetical protein [Fluviispira multicolorata]|uniref:Outer membrane protein beta-barrel domain-containing protein n=1 Tax=Fluviispira multicolorata TaxID=2654512 RepID=A0A833JDB9_9BACT|nr:hypothetical protein [Fluviispira multicolorata]KAB8031820.1 hypothetical protein GCL57_04035 [Fluviispira multicolorata]